MFLFLGFPVPFPTCCCRVTKINSEILRDLLTKLLYFSMLHLLLSIFKNLFFQMMNLTTCSDKNPFFTIKPLSKQRLIAYCNLLSRFPILKIKFLTKFLFSCCCVFFILLLMQVFYMVNLWIFCFDVGCFQFPFCILSEFLKLLLEVHKNSFPNLFFLN